MKKTKKRLKSSLLAGAFSLLMASGWSMDGKLSDISRPYLGTYECQSFYYGSENKLDDFDYVRVELLADGTLTLSYKEKDKKAKSVLLVYEYDQDGNILKVSTKNGLIKSDKKIRLEDGEIVASFPIGKRNVNAKFKK